MRRLGKGSVRCLCQTDRRLPATETIDEVEKGWRRAADGGGERAREPRARHGVSARGRRATRATQCGETKRPALKTGKRPEETDASPKKMLKRPRSTEKTLNVTRHQADANPKHDGRPPRTR